MKPHFLEFFRSSLAGSSGCSPGTEEEVVGVAASIAILAVHTFERRLDDLVYALLEGIKLERIIGQESGTMGKDTRDLIIHVQRLDEGISNQDVWYSLQRLGWTRHVNTYWVYRKEDDKRTE